MRAYDREHTRIIFLDEFKQRCEKLLIAVKKGELDDFFGTPPFEILHRINGLHGELLPRLEIDPTQSRIYKTVRARAKFIIVENEENDQKKSQSPSE
jgi:hypothetical protein